MSAADWLGEPKASLDVSIAIVNWNTGDLLRGCLTSLEGAMGSLDYEVIVVDNASRDDSVVMVARDFPDVRLLVNERNLGFAVATNQALRLARGRYLVLLNSDTLALPGAFSTMISYLDAHPRAGALGPRLLNADRSLQESAFRFPDMMRDAMTLARSHLVPGTGRPARQDGQAVLRSFTHTGPVDWIYGACLVLRREALAEIGLLDEGYFFGNEEVDICLRLRKRGWRVVYLTDAAIVHFGAQSWLHMAPTRVTWFYVGRLRYFKMHYSWWECLLQRAAIAVIAAGQVTRLLLRRHRSRDDGLRLAAFARVLARALAG
jgi:GT2 family glycosyltransferase